ncbi:flagellar hook-associated protein FlgK [Rhodoferax fermentans]|uniref:Flagellar hook-associated protein 1 n=1 Tax=Rhodoferax fermentans TaxID=28066 RepID=A0A1T1AXT2_RHOFE|nr:flagellar hook-associated protein FlgK [Rhodoferax fermentans]MBK1683852.1 flagellar hook-associated protein FlgK [Rhodoferax fermentans]OOV08778.1 flagellar hook-associated protein FlgK [Rhodoferax fermentans]
MSGILNVATRALMANQTILQTTGNNIANVNTPGYSRQNAVLQTVEGQFTGGGYIGKGVDVVTIQRNYSAFLTRQSALAGATASGDSARADKLKQLEALFPGGTNGLGASVNDMLNAFADVASAPTDLTARTVALTRVDEAASRMRSASTTLDDLQLAVKQELEQKVNAVNSLANSIAAVNDQIARAQGTGQQPNDLLDRRDQLVRELNKYIQTSSIPASDGTMGIFIGGSQALVLGTSVAPLSIVKDDFGDPLKSKLAITHTGTTTTLDENTLGGGEVTGLLKFQNTDLAEGRNLLGRLTLAISTSMNTQHALGLDLDGNPGGKLFTATNINTPSNILKPSTQAASTILTLGIADVTKFEASDYEITFTGAAAGSITRKSDGVVTAFTAVPITIDGLTIAAAGAANAGDRFLIKPFSTAASDIRAEFSTPRALAVASPIAGKMGTTNTGSLQLASLTAKTNTPTPPHPAPVTISFTGANSYTRSDVAGTFTFTSGQAIASADWSVVLQGVPKAGDTFTVVGIKDTANNNGIDFKLNAGNASSMMGLRDKAMFDGAALTDGYASMIAQIGIRSQSANYAAEVSGTIAANLETDRTGVSGVNLDEEASKLLQYQQAYQASAKVIQIAQGIFDTLIQTMSR